MMSYFIICHRASHNKMLIFFKKKILSYKGSLCWILDLMQAYAMHMNTLVSTISTN